MFLRIYITHPQFNNANYVVQYDTKENAIILQFSRLLDIALYTLKLNGFGIGRGRLAIVAVINGSNHPEKWFEPSSNPKEYHFIYKTGLLNEIVPRLLLEELVSSLYSLSSL